MKESKQRVKTLIRKNVNAALGEMGIKTSWKLKILSPHKDFKRIVSSVAEEIAYGKRENPRELRECREAEKAVYEWFDKRWMKEKDSEEHNPSTSMGFSTFRRRYPYESWKKFAEEKGLSESLTSNGERMLSSLNGARVLFPAPKTAHVFIPIPSGAEPTEYDAIPIAAESGHIVYHVACDQRGLRPNRVVGELFDWWFKERHSVIKAEGYVNAPIAASANHIESAALFLRILSKAKSRAHAEKVVHSLAERDFKNYGEIARHIDAKLKEIPAEEDADWHREDFKRGMEIFGGLSDYIEMGGKTKEHVLEAFRTHDPGAAYSAAIVNEIAGMDDESFEDEDALDRLEVVSKALLKHSKREMEMARNEENREWHKGKVELAEIALEELVEDRAKLAKKRRGDG